VQKIRFKILIYAVCVYFIMLLQTTVLNYFEIYNVKPNLTIIFIVAIALLRGNIEGAAVGFFTGLLQDMVGGKVIGLYALLGLYLGLAIGSVNKRLYRENYLVIIFFTFVSSIAYEFAVFFLCTVLPLALYGNGGQIDLLMPVKNIILPEAFYNSLISIFIYAFVIKLNYKFEDISKSARKY
jgi:rod shape-determining protein MreD